MVEQDTRAFIHLESSGIKQVDVFKNVVLIVMYGTVADDLCALAMAYVLLDCGVYYYY